MRTFQFVTVDVFTDRRFGGNPLAVFPDAQGLTPKVDTCVQHFMSSWHFGIPRDKAGEATEAAFKIALVLKKS